MAERSEYVVNVGGIPHTFLLTEQEAKKAGAQPKTKAVEQPKNKARKPDSNKEG